LACSIFDYIVDDFDMVKNLNECTPLVKLIVEWCMDDNNINMLYKNNGVERYPDFKLYKMISRYVHKHTPDAQLERSEFNKYIVTNKHINKNEIIINIDILPCYSNLAE
jgi:phage host-nuclease inhibitor protein Gam